jgi:uncharacterized repeat protein (TIGR03803 family)
MLTRPIRLSAHFALGKNETLMPQAKQYSPSLEVAASPICGLSASGIAWALAIIFSIAFVPSQKAHAQTLVTLYNFAGEPDGSAPFANLIRDAAGNLYGTTGIGGATNNGTVFEISSQGVETIIHSFGGSPPPDGRGPYAGLLRDKDGNLYGTTSYGGIHNLGTVFKITASGEEQVLYSFKGSDGASPNGGLILDSEGHLFGTTSFGGAGSCPSVGKNGCGIVFVLSQSGTEHVLYSFQGGSDGAFPSSTLVRDTAGNLYGTTGSGGCSYGENCGTVFRISRAGEKVLHRFSGPNDGTGPNGVIFGPGGNLYGTTVSGGTYNRGTVFGLTPEGKEKVLYSFGSVPNDGTNPYAGLVWDRDATFYGTTNQGGPPNCLNGCGTIFSVTTVGVETVLYYFGANGTEGFIPFAGLIRDPAGNLYGTTGEGGPTDNGTVFEFTPLGQRE